MAASASQPPPAPSGHPTELLVPLGVVRSMPPDPARHERQLHAMMDIAWAIRSTLQVDSLLPQIMDKVTALMRADRSTFFVVDHARGELWSKVLQADLAQPPREIRLRVGDGIAGWVAQTGQSVVLNDAYDDARFDRTWDIKSGYRTRSLLCVPIYDREQRVIAALQCLNKENGKRFDAEDEELLRSVGGQCAVALESAFLYESLVDRNRALQEAEGRLRRANAELEMLYDLEQHISESSDLTALATGALERVCNLLGVRGAVLMLLHDGAPSVFVATRDGRPLELLTLEGREAQRILQHARIPVHRVQDASGALADALVHELLGPSGVRETFSAPLSDGRSHFGLLQLVDRSEPRAEESWLLRMASLVASQLARGIVMQRERAQGEREQRLALLGHSVGALLHDLRTPMTAIGGFAELMASEQDSAQREDFSARIDRALQHMESMTQEVLAFARGRRDVLVQKVYVDRFIDAVREMLLPETQGFGVKLVVHADYEGTARFDENKLKRVIFNLARNACQAMGAGGTFTWRVRQEDAQLVFECTDTGPGIPREMEGRLFESFATHGKTDGTGLGLAMAKKIVDAHCGTLSCTSVLGQGATFRIALPL
jgi:signal transduction histidine kinase